MVGSGIAKLEQRASARRALGLARRADARRSERRAVIWELGYFDGFTGATFESLCIKRTMPPIVA